MDQSVRRCVGTGQRKITCIAEEFKKRERGIREVLRKFLIPALPAASVKRWP